MSYTIRRFDKSNTIPALIVNDKKFDTSTTTLTFFGLNSVDFGVGLNENYLHLMEHFNNKDIALAKVVPGQLWFDKSIRKMKIWTGNRWHILKEYTTNKLPKGFVTIVGSLVNGSTVSTANTLYDEDGLGDFSYQWYLDTNIIPNATDSTYTILLSDVGHMLAVSLSYTDGNHNKEIVYSKEYAINAAANHLPTGSLTIDGIIEIGQTLTAVVNDIQDADGMVGGGGNFGWLVDGDDIPTENNNTYTIKPDDGGKTIKAKYYFTDLSNNSEVVYSNSVVIPYAVTTTTSGPTTTTTAAPGPTTTTTKSRPDTSALDSAIAKCNATVPALKDTWFAAEADRVITSNNYMAACSSAVDQFDDIVTNTNTFDSDALKLVKSTYEKWNIGINACIKNKQDLFNILQDEASAQILAAAYQAKLDVLASNITTKYTYRTTVVNKYIDSIMAANDTHEWSHGLLGLMAVDDDANKKYTDSITLWNSTYNDALTVNKDILVKILNSASVTRISNLCDYKISTYNDIKTKDTDYYTLVHSKYLATAGIDPVGDTSFKINDIGSIDTYAQKFKNSSTTKYTTALTDKPDIVNAANQVLAG